MDAVDRDLLVLESRVFRDVGFASQRRLEASGSISGTSLSVGGVNLVAAGISAGMVAVFGPAGQGVSVEIVSVTNATSCVVSSLRSVRDGAAIAPVVAAGSQSVVIGTFGPQLQGARQEIERLANLGEGEQIVQDGSGRLLQCVLALRAIYQIAAEGAPEGSWLGQKLAWYQQRVRTETMRCVLKVEVDGEVVERRLFAGQMSRH
jgi:hypothetical protein